MTADAVAMTNCSLADYCHLLHPVSVGQIDISHTNISDIFYIELVQGEHRFSVIENVPKIKLNIAFHMIY